MVKQINKDTYSFLVKNKKIELFYAEDGHVEICDIDDPFHTGFIFEDDKKLSIFINTITDIIEKRNMENVKWVKQNIKKIKIKWINVAKDIIKTIY